MKEYIILISAVDNRLTVELNGKNIYDSGLSYQPRLFNPPVEIPITRWLQPQKNNLLTINCYNGAISAVNYDHRNPYHFAYRIVERNVDTSLKDVITPVALKGESKPCIWLTPKRYAVKPENGGFMFNEVK